MYARCWLTSDCVYISPDNLALVPFTINHHAASVLGEMCLVPAQVNPLMWCFLHVFRLFVSQLLRGHWTFLCWEYNSNYVLVMELNMVRGTFDCRSEL